MEPRFQFSLGNILFAMFWASLVGGSLALLPKLDNLPDGWLKESYEVSITVLLFLLTACPFIATGALFGRAAIGFLVGTFVFIASSTVFWLFFTC